MGKHRLAGSRAQGLGMVDVRSAGHHGVHEREHLATGTGTADSPTEPDGGVHQLLEAEARHQRGDQDEPGVGDQVGLIKAHPEAVDPVRYSTH